jgi:thiol-disulfide isomerase/thioredoxin
VTEVTLLARVVLLAVLVLSAAAKLLDRPGTRGAVAAFGVPARLVPAAATGLPAVELGGAALLLGPGLVGRTGSALVALLLLVLTAAVVRTLRAGTPMDCHCFGHLGAGPAGWGTVARNAVLVVLAALGTADLSSVPAALANLGAAVLAGLVLVLVVAAAVAVAVRGDGRAPLPTASPTEVPMVTLPDLDGVEVSLADVVADGLPALVVFTRPGCGGCAELLPELERWQNDEGPVHVVVVGSGSLADNQAEAAAHPGLRVLLQQARWVTDRFAIAFNPGAVLVGADGAVLGDPVYGPNAVRENYAVVRDGLLEQGHTARRAVETLR